jgi:hypothetical protein
MPIVVDSGEVDDDDHGRQQSADQRDDVEDRDQDGEGQRVLPQAMITKNA